MEIPQNVRNKLKCSECKELFSCGPVFFLHETAGVICGRCSQPSKSKIYTTTAKKAKRTRIEPYEAIASLLAFPCVFAPHGCTKNLPFSLGPPAHEANCDFRPVTCPIASRGSCDWINPWFKLKQHCDETHPQHIFKAPCKIPRPDLTNPNPQTYVVSAYNFLFLLQIKVCVASGNLYHSLQLYGDQKYLEKFSVTLEIEGNGLKLTKSGPVLRGGILMLQEPTAICKTINNLLGLFDGKYNDSLFQIRVQAFFKYCVNCFTRIENNPVIAKFCAKCEGKLFKCKLFGKECSFVDVSYNKREKHNHFFCPLNTSCYFCEEHFAVGELISHLMTCHKALNSDLGSVVRVTRKNEFVFFANNYLGPVLCEFDYAKTTFHLNLFTVLPSYELKRLRCLIKLVDPQTKHTSVLIPKLQKEKYMWNDWSVNEKYDDFPSLENVGIDVKINIDLM